MAWMVSILVFLELALGRKKANRILCLDSVFQSLFSWNLPSDLLVAYHIIDIYNVSILVFLELALGP